MKKGRLWQKRWPDHPELQQQVVLAVPFQDADPTGMAWHGNYFRYYDAARVAVLGSIDFGYREMAEIEQIWPIVDTRVRYLKSLSFGTNITVTAQLVEWEFRLCLYYQIFDDQGARVNEAYTIQVPVNAADERLLIGSPPALVERIQQRIGGADDGC